MDIKVNLRAQKTLTFVPRLSHIHSIYDFLAHLLKIRFYIMLPSTSMYSQLSLQVSPSKLCMQFSFPDACPTPRPSHGLKQGVRADMTLSAP
jgi:hypothetical protein